MTHVIEMPARFVAAEIRAASYSEADNSIECVWAAGATVRRMSWMDGPYDEELIMSANAVRLGRLNAGAPLLDTHMSWSLANVLGSVVPGSARIVGGQGVARVTLSKAPGDADAVAKIRDGIVRNVSTGYAYHQVEKTERDGQVPLWRVVDWEPMELTACPMGADPAAQFRSVQGSGKPGDKPLTFPCSFRGASAADIARLRMQMTRRRAGIVSDNRAA